MQFDRDDAKAAGIQPDLEDILKSIGRNETEIANVKEEIKSQAAEAKNFTECCL